MSQPIAPKEVALVSNKSISDKGRKDMVEDRTVINMSNRPLIQDEVSILSEGMNFTPTQSKIPIKDFIAATEYGIKDLSIGEANLIRCDVLRILKKAKIPKSSISHKEKVLLSELKIPLLSCQQIKVVPLS
ncbi:hypothetical protein HOLleu_29074 [Holothuria leucospilota]|uniref:Uncharacterized protein n=1 Tax=Holothuria leucospilota TaxID=206669 RepID=A0A9Q1BNC2_HOLLE|nr:hypothetical protein HOLleu_29074 [Holothuria leucospilota]